MLFAEHLLNFIGAFVRWMLQHTYKPLFGIQLLTLKDYTEHPTHFDDIVDIGTHKMINAVVGIATIGGICILILR